MTAENMGLRIQLAADTDDTDTFVETVRDALRRYPESEVAEVIGLELLDKVKARIGTGACAGLCLTGSDVGVPSAAIAYPHPDCPEHGDADVAEWRASGGGS